MCANEHRARPLNSVVRRHQKGGANCEQRTVGRQLPLWCGYLSCRGAVQAICALPLPTVPQSYWHRACYESLRCTRQLRMADRRRTHGPLRSAIRKEFRDSVLPNLRLTASSLHPQWTHSSHTGGLAERRSWGVAAGPNILGLKSSVVGFVRRCSDIQRIAGVVAIGCRLTTP
jgi:hypothetical protein